VTKLVVPTS